MVSLTLHDFLLGVSEDNGMQFDQRLVINLAFGVTLEWSAFNQVIFQQSEMDVFFVFLCAEEPLDVRMEISDYNKNEDKESSCVYVSLEVCESW